MAVFIVLWPYLLTTKIRCLQKNKIGHTNAPTKFIAFDLFWQSIFFKDRNHLSQFLYCGYYVMYIVHSMPTQNENIQASEICGMGWPGFQFINL